MLLGRYALQLSNRDLERSTGIPVPDLDRVHPVPVRNLAGLQQEVDRGGRAALAGRRLVAKGLDEMAAFGMRLHAEFDDHFLGRRGREADDVFFVRLHRLLSPAQHPRRTTLFGAGIGMQVHLKKVNQRYRLVFPAAPVSWSWRTSILP